MSADKNTQKVTLTSNEGSTIEVGRSIGLLPRPADPA